MFTTFKDVVKRARALGGKTIAVAAANDHTTLHAFDMAAKKKLARGVLVGDQKQIEAIAREGGIDLSKHEIVNVPDEKEAAAVACSLVREGRADVLMKGLVKTGTFMKAVLDPERGLRSGKLLSHVFVFEDPLQGKLVMVTDGGINIRPTFDEKAEIVRNAVRLFMALGGERARVAALAAVETVNEKMPETLDAQKLQQLAEAGQLGDCVVHGPAALDIAISPEAAQVKGLSGPVLGHADVLLAPDIASGNILGKSLMYYAGVANAGAVVGAAAPVIFLSRADSEATKLNSISLCICAAAQSSGGSSPTP